MSNIESRNIHLRTEIINDLVTNRVFGDFCISVLRGMYGSKNITELHGSTTYFDFKLNSRLDGKKGSTYFEFKTYVSEEVLDIMINRFIRHAIRKEASDEEKSNTDFVLLLYTKPNSKIKKWKRNLDEKTQIWDLDDFAFKGGSAFVNFVDLLLDPEYYITTIFTKESTIPNIKNSKIRSRNFELEILRQSYSTRKMSIILGAGISKAAKLPLWNELLDEMYLNAFVENGLVSNQSDIDSLLSILKKETDNPIVRAGYLRKMYQKEHLKDMHYFESMRNVLYRNVNRDCSLLESLVRLCFPNKNRTSFVSRVITYNFDDLLEQTFTEKKIQYNTIASREQMINDKRKFPIYHVHGFIPQNKSERTTLQNVILSEEDYHRVYRDSFDWSNIVQANALFEDPCLFIGTSISDPNMRRILEYSSLENSEIRHFAFFQRTIYSIDSTVEHSNIKEMYSNFKDELIEMYLRKFNIRVIWYDNHDELPEIINRLAKSQENGNIPFFEDINFRR